MLIALIKNWKMVAVVLAFVIATGGAFMTGKRFCEVRVIEKTIENVKVKNAVTEKLSRVKPGDRRKRLLGWSQ